MQAKDVMVAPVVTVGAVIPGGVLVLLETPTFVY